jgi:ribonuclease HI
VSVQLSWPGGSHNDCELIVFDKDGTIIDFESVWLNMAAARAQWLADKLSSNSAELFTWRNRFLRAAGVEPESGRISLSGPIVNLSFENQSYCLATLLHTILPEKYSWKQALEFTSQSIEWALHHNDPAKLAAPIKGAFEFIKEIAQTNIKLALLTSDSTDNAKRTLERFGVLDLFCVVQGSDINPAKPSPRALLKVCKQAGVDPSRTIVIGDAPNDVRMSLEANIPAICLEGLATDQELLELGASATFKTWSEISFKQKQTPPVEGLILRTDGASRGNPGQASIAYVIFDAKGNRLSGSGKPIGSQTNNYAEYSALIYGLKEVIKLKPEKLLIEIDSELIVKQVQKIYKVKDAVLQKLYAEVVDLLKLIDKKWKIKHIPRSNNHEADELCNKALDTNTEVQ